MTAAPATTTLTAFLTARLDEDEAAARTVVDSHAMYDWESFVASAGMYESPAHDFAVRHDPARVLAQVAAVRAVVAEHRLITDPARLVKVWRDPTPGMACERCAGDPLGNRPLEDIGPCDTLRHLAAVYADHPDFREEWRA